MEQYMSFRESMPAKKIEDLVADGRAKIWLEQADQDKVNRTIRDFEEQGIESIGVSITEMKQSGRTFEALVLYGKAGEAAENLCLIDLREVVIVGDIYGNPYIKEVENEEEASKAYWYNPVNGVPNEGGRFEVPPGTILQRRESFAGETRYVLVKESVLADLEARSDTNYDNQRVISVGKRSYWMKAKFSANPQRDPNKPQTLEEHFNEMLGLGNRTGRGKIEQLQDADPTKRMQAVKELYDTGKVTVQGFKEYLRDTNKKEDSPKE